MSSLVVERDPLIIVKCTTDDGEVEFNSRGARYTEAMVYVRKNGKKKAKIKTQEDLFPVVGTEVLP